MFNPTFDADSLLNRMTAALTNKVDQRCADLTVLFERGSRKELEAFFPILVDHVFGPQGTFSWSLRNIFQTQNSTEYTVLVNFLKPMGPVFKLIYSLLQDHSIKYDFSLAYLPEKVKQMLEGSNVYPFYSEMLQYNSQSKQPVSLLLNPFDYYIFHFFYHLINPCHQRMALDDLWDSAYFNLCTEYILHFFPTTIEYSIKPSISFYQGKNPMQSPQAFQRQLKHTTLLKSNLFGDPQVRDFSTMHQMMEKHPRSEIWRSETILMAFIDFWLSNDQVCKHYDTLNMSCNSTGLHLELPSADYIRIIRMVIKHLHAFVSAANYDNSSLGELKKITLPMIQSRMYIFLRNLLYRWPLDESFRLVLELWLSFIQPWRYSHDLYAARGGIHKSTNPNLSGNKELVKFADESYLPFIAENLLTYVVIFQQLLPRFTRVDLSSPKNAQMLFRLAKVFNQPNLVPLIKKIECVVENKNYSPTHHQYNSSFAGNMPPLSPTTRWSTNTSAQIYDSTHIESPKKNCSFITHDYDNLAGKYATAVRQKIYELEGPNFRYSPLFTEHVAPEVYELLQMVRSAETKAIIILQERRKQEEETTGFFSLFSSIELIDKVSLLDRQKAPNFLRCSLEYLIEIFNIKNFHDVELSPDTTDSSGNTSGFQDRHYINALTPNRIKERLNGLRYEGDPDLIPIRSFENEFLVRVLYDLSRRINETYGLTINELYYNRGILGRIARNFIRSPERIYKYKKYQGLSKRVPYDLPARISMRSFANHSFLLFIFFGTIIFWYFGYGIYAFIFLYVLFYFFLIFIKAVFKRSDRPIELNLNFDDTMEE